MICFLAVSNGSFLLVSDGASVVVVGGSSLGQLSILLPLFLLLTINVHSTTVVNFHPLPKY